MKTVELFRNRIVLAESRFADPVIWRFSRPLPGSRHSYKHRLAYIVKEICVLRYDNESGKGGHRHRDERESEYAFVSPDKLLAHFQPDIERWNHENGYS
jgi:hypothetical protein